ncbi:DUF6325 family protein [Ilumatobacter nonamiensis]|uniref:DUF6325 family protein n=1 Tax=Ilumatobacter nonamiensis TaxID=467093 RepID=UPI0003458582|nr:DUF6325 family protein [Ilumatobacter nonamiensis]
MSVRRETGRSVDPQLVEYLVVVVPDERSIEDVLDAVETLASRRQVVLLDGAIVGHDRSGEVVTLEMPRSECRPALLEARRGVLSSHDLELIAVALPARSLAVVVVVEDEWAQPLASAVRAVGGYVAGGERIPAARLIEVLPQLRSPRRETL